MRKNHLSKVKNSQLELEKDFMKLKDKLKDRGKETEKLFHQPIIVSKDNIDKLEEQEIKKIRPIIRN